MQLDHIVWRPAREVLDEEDSADHNVPFRPPPCVYGSLLYPPANGEHARPPTPLIEVKDFSANKWLKEQECRHRAPIGARVLLRRRFHELVAGLVVQDTMMIRVDTPHKWDKYHVFYFNHEPSPLPLHTKKRKFT